MKLRQGKQKVKKYITLHQYTSVIILKISADSPGALQGKMIRLAREAVGMTQKQLAQSLSVSRATIIKWERHGIGNEIYQLEQILKVEHGAFKIND